MDFQIGQADPLDVRDCEIESLLHDVYVADGYTSPQRAAVLFMGEAVRRRGVLIGARPAESDDLAGMVVLVCPGSPGHRLAAQDEVELHLLAVAHRLRGAGLGRRLVGEAINMAGRQGYRKALLWTQPTMAAAHRLYESEGFVRAPERDPVFSGLRFLAYQKQW